MSNYDMDQLMGTYADWVAWLKEKEASLAGQLARMKGKKDGRPETGDGSSAPAMSEDGRDVSPDEVRPEIETPPEDTPPSPSPTAGDDTSPSVAESDADDAEDWL